MKAFVRAEYGPPTVFQLQDVNRPVPKDDEVLVHVRASSLNQGDLDYLYGKAFLTRMGTGLRVHVNLAWVSTQPGRWRRLARTSPDSSAVMRCSRIDPVRPQRFRGVRSRSRASLGTHPEQHQL